MAKKSYDKMYEEKKVNVAPAEEPKATETPDTIPEEKFETPKKSEAPLTKPFMGTVTGGLGLNVRNAPDGQIIAVLPEGAQVKILDNSNSDWYKIETPDGFVMKKFIKKG